MNDIMSEPKAVHVCAYTRTRNGRLEHVREHWRSWPGQLDLFSAFEPDGNPVSGSGVYVSP
jgi:hypothetical protein